MPTHSKTKTWLFHTLTGVLMLVMLGCRWEPSERELQNGRAFEALLTAVSLKNLKEVEGDAGTIDERHASGEMSDEPYARLSEVVRLARAGDWQGAEKLAYEFRARFGDDGAYFK